MNAQLPDRLEPLGDLVVGPWGFSQVEDSTAASFGNRLVVFDESRFRLRFLSDRSIWFIELAEKSKPDEWYDTALLRDAVEGTGGPDEMTLDEKVEFWKAKWENVRRMFEQDALETHVKLERLQKERAKRMFPTAYK